MDTRNKLSEAKYFLEILFGVQDDTDKFYYNLSAFITAWRSTLDYMLYDFAEIFNLGFTRDDEMTEKEFRAVSNALNKTKALAFIRWWSQKQNILSGNPLWSKRNLNIHRGRAPITKSYVFHVSGSGGTSGTISFTTSGTLSSSSIGVWTPLTSSYIPTQPTSSYITTSGNAISEWTFSDFPDESAIDICRKAYDEMKKIVEEAETEFVVQL